MQFAGGMWKDCGVAELIRKNGNFDYTNINIQILLIGVMLIFSKSIVTITSNQL